MSHKKRRKQGLFWEKTRRSEFETMFISIVIPAYNEEHYLGRCLQALRDQSYPASQFEIIVVDNVSTEATADIAHCFGDRVVHEPRKGVSRARQTGFEAVRGDIIASTDANTLQHQFPEGSK